MRITGGLNGSDLHKGGLNGSEEVKGGAIELRGDSNGHGEVQGTKKRSKDPRRVHWNSKGSSEYQGGNLRMFK